MAERDSDRPAAKVVVVDDHPPAEASQLTAREEEIIRLAAQGTASSAIGAALGLSTRTVENHLARIYKKLGINSRAQLANVVVSALVQEADQGPNGPASARPLLPVGTLAGRADELALLDGYLKDLAEGGGNAVLIEGEPGIGKTALVRTAIAGLAPDRYQVFWGAGDELGQVLPLLPFLDALRVREPSINARRNTIVRLLRGEIAADRGADVPATLAEQLLALVQEESAVRPVVLVIDDLQWADLASVAFWGRLARTVHQFPLLLIGAARPVPHRDDLLALRRFAGDDGRIQLTGLAESAVADLVAVLVGGRPDGSLLRLAEGAAGNPLYLTELVAALVRSGGITITSWGTAQLTADSGSPSLTGAIADRLSFVAGPVREVLRLAALLGVDFEIRDLATVLGRTVLDLLPAIDEARVAGVLTESGNTLGFRHPLIRTALYDEMPAVVRAAWHRDAARALADAGAPPDRVARQLLRAISQPTSIVGKPDALARVEAGSGKGVDMEASSSTRTPAIQIERPPVGPGASFSTGPIDEWILDWLSTSADSLVSQAPGVAAELLALAVDGIPAGSVRHRWLASRLADALYRTGDLLAAEQVATQALEHTADPDLLVDLHWTLAQCRMLAGHFAESIATVEQALSTPGLSTKHRARLLVLAARTRLYSGDRQAAREEAESARTAATEVADTWAVGWALHVLACVAAGEGDMLGGLFLYDQALAVAETDQALADLGLLLQVNKAVVLFNLDRCDEALATAERARQRADQAGTAIRVAQAHNVLCQVLYEMGRWDPALTEMAGSYAELNGPFEACRVLAITAVICFHRGEVAEARRHLEAAARYDEKLGHRLVGRLALARSLEREYVGALPDALAALTLGLEPGAEDIEEFEGLFADAVRLAIRTGDMATANSLAQQATTLAEGSEIPHREANALYCRGLLEHDAGQLLAAARRYEDASRPLLVAKAYEAAAVEFVRMDDRGQARDAFIYAIEEYTSLGAAADVARLRAAFRAHGIHRGPHSRHRRAVSGWDSLTDTEVKVAGLVAKGLSNREIADNLMLSRRTVSTHVSHILKKLGVASRTDIAQEPALRAALS